MAGLLDNLVGEKMAETMPAVTLEKFQVFKEERKVHIELLAEEVLGRELINRFSDTVKERFGLLAVDLKVIYKESVLSTETAGLIYENMLEELYEENPAVRGILLHSCGTFENGNFLVHLKFGGEKTLEDKGVLRFFEKQLKEQYGSEVTVAFRNDSMSADELLTKLESQKAELLRDTSVAAAEAEAKIQAAKPVKKQKIEKPETSEDVIFGKPFGGEITPIKEIDENSGKVIVEGKVIAHEVRELRNKKTLLELYVADKESCMICKAFLKEEEFAELKGGLKKLKGVRIAGRAQYDTYAKEVVIIFQDIMKAKTKIRPDEAEVKRVELHAHTTMSAEDALAKPKDLIARAAAWGHKAIAITDHGVVQAYPEAYDAGKDNDIKIIYGMEAYLEADSVTFVQNPKPMPLSGDFVVFDIETTSLSARFGEIIEIAGVKISDGRTVGQFSEFVKPTKSIPYHITELTNISNDMVRDADPIETVLPAFLEFCKGCVLVAHNAGFDVGYIKKKAEELSLDFDFCYMDTLMLSRRLLTALKTHKLNRVAKHLGFVFEGHHRAINDAEVTARIFLHFLELMSGMDIKDVSEINERLYSDETARYNDTYHAIILVKDMVGLKNLYKLVSFSHIDHYNKRPRISKELFSAHREGLILGSACEAGELYQKMLRGATEEELTAIASYYDYLEIQPLGNNSFMIRDHLVEGKAELETMNKAIVELGDKLGKRVVAACDVHFLEPDDAIYREVLQTAKGYDDANHQAPLYLRTTDEMLAEFSYLPADKAYEIVVTNTNDIADEIGDILPIPKETYPPEMPGATEELQELSYGKAHELYGEELPELVKQRMEKELVPIIKYGFSVMYMIAQKLVTKSLSDGYLVGSRGSVGSSFIAFLSGITEINSLPPHYLCPKCKNVEFILDGSFSMGADMPDRICPKCGEKYKKDGYDIPFETFLGFDGDKEPDIDLNFSGEYQSVAHKYTETLFGEGNVFRAGTIGTLAENTAMGYVKKYAEANGISLTKAQMKRLSLGLEGVKRTTGQHPGGVMIVPRANEVYEFTPIQHPADKADSGVITTHFDYHSISGRLLKLDILGHDDPSMIRMLEDLTGLNARTIPIDDKPTMSLFTSTEALGVTPEDIGSEVGTFAVPEFGTKFVRQMLLDTKPTTFSELIRISGLSHGTDVWTNNAQDLVRAGTATLPEVICTRDDIMLYLLQHDLPPLTSFKIMEKVRKGKGLAPEDEELMREKGVPEWYITSCKTIKYMFPKAHAAAYVTMAFRIAYFKVHYPISFYIAYYTVRATDFDAERMLGGKERVMAAMRE
ncbi:MAG: PolC-type DNA polymerase III, partial [Ruminococcaceae bacterium]|nr:PolC-type DNA polymerase III [Oscillospiraceae bacterium]